jgi:2-amino-4-hydroxy-6-hydroxymethyldihydropteridine diphosphokinase
VSERVFVAIGSNVGDRHAHVAHAAARLAELPQTRLVRLSGVIETEPVGGPSQGRYLNAVAELLTSLEPDALLQHLLAIERERGRDRTGEVRFGPRTLDLDLLIHGSRRIRTPGLQVPHPRMAERDFVLLPLAEIAPEVAAAVRGGAIH